MIGETVGNFEIVAELGRGGMGAVFLAEQKAIRTKAAIKVLHAAIADDAHVKRFFNEARAVSQIPHAGIVRIFDVGHHTGGQPYLVMEFLEGEGLAKRITARGKLGLGEVADFGRQIASVLDATHGAGIVHRDLKPENIYLVRDAELARGERVKVLDFGIAKLAKPGQANRMTSLDASSVGTPSYMSPEQWHSLAEVDWRTDAYALGCVVFEMACGRPPFVGESMADVCAQHLTDPPPVPSALVPGLPKALDDLVRRLLEKEPAGRPTMKETMAVLAGLAQPAPARGVAATPPPAVMTAPPSGAVATRPPVVAPGMTAGPPAMPTAPAVAAPSPIVAPPPARRPRRRWLLALGALAITGSAAAAVFVAASSSKGGADDAGGDSATAGGSAASPGSATSPAGGGTTAGSAPVVVATAPADAAVAPSPPAPDAAVIATATPDAAPAVRATPPPPPDASGTTTTTSPPRTPRKPPRTPPKPEKPPKPAKPTKPPKPTSGEPAHAPTTPAHTAELAPGTVRRLVQKAAATCHSPSDLQIVVAVEPSGKARVIDDGGAQMHVSRCLQTKIAALAFPKSAHGGAVQVPVRGEARPRLETDNGGDGNGGYGGYE